MKKLFIALLAMAATMNAMAIDYTAKAKLLLTSNSGETCEMTIAQTDDPDAAYYCTQINMKNRLVAIYAIANSKNYQIYANADVEGLPLGFLTNADTEYTISFSDVIGKLYLVDAVEDKFIEITEGGSYAFTAEANQTIADRFSIAKSLPYLFVGHKLTIGEVEDGAVINLQYFTYDNGKRVLGDSETSTEKVIELSTAKGYCEISYTNKAGVARKFIVNPAPVVTPAN